MEKTKYWTKERVLREIKARSIDGVAVSTTHNETLFTVARREFGSWAAACEKAGVRTRGYDKKPITKMPSDKTKKLAYLLHRAQKYAGRVDERLITKCIFIARGM